MRILCPRAAEPATLTGTLATTLLQVPHRPPAYKQGSIRAAPSSLSRVIKHDDAAESRPHADAIFGGALARLTTSGDYRSVANLAAGFDANPEQGSPQARLSRNPSSEPHPGLDKDLARNSGLRSRSGPRAPVHSTSNGSAHSEKPAVLGHNSSTGSTSASRRPSGAENMQQIFESQPPASPGFWVGYGTYDYADGTNILDTLPEPPPPAMCGPDVEDPLRPFCCKPPEVGHLHCSSSCWPAKCCLCMPTTHTHPLGQHALLLPDARPPPLTLRTLAGVPAVQVCDPGRQPPLLRSVHARAGHPAPLGHLP